MAGKYFKPNPSSDPSIKSAGYGWGWLVLLFGCMIQLMAMASVLAVSTAQFLMIAAICILLFSVLYFRLRKTFIDKRRYGDNIWRSSLVAGMATLFVGGSLMLVGFYILAQKN